MLSWDLDKNNNITLTAKTVSGKKQISLVDKIDALRVALDSALQVVKGELDDTTKGVDYFGIILTDTPLSIKVQELTRVIKQNTEVQEVFFKRAEVNREGSQLKFYFDIKSIYGQFSYDNTFEIV